MHHHTPLDGPGVPAKMTHNLPSNVHVSTHPCVRGKLSQLRSASTHARDTKTLVHDIAGLVGCEAFAHGLKVVEVGKVSASSLMRPALADKRRRCELANLSAMYV